MQCILTVTVKGNILCTYRYHIDIYDPKYSLPGETYQFTFSLVAIVAVLPDLQIGLRD